ncbi:unnamed protein product [Prorocentrum cordatum]|uniref:Solute carrier family 40 protein n=1 Tax=Prorocentrum cordatum TaxID=2364126 RepID=A0ABN9WQE0_9DINO|nr:unnamed protein product [Polarella glacialis]
MASCSGCQEASRGPRPSHLEVSDLLVAPHSPGISSEVRCLARLAAASGLTCGVTRGILQVFWLAGGIGAHVSLAGPVALLGEERESPGALLSSGPASDRWSCLLHACWRHGTVHFRLAVALMTRSFLTPIVFCVVLVACASTHAATGVILALHDGVGDPLPQSDINEEELQTFPFEQGCSACTATRKPHKRTASAKTGSVWGQRPLGQAPPNYGGGLPGVGPGLQRVS